MSLYPNILHTSTYNTTLAQHPQPHSEPPKPTSQHHHHHHHHIDYHSLLTNLFTPTAHLQCTSSTPLNTPATTSEAQARPKLLPDDDLVLLIPREPDRDGAPLCREAGIQEWKGEGSEGKEGEKRQRQGQRRRSLEWLAGVIGRM